MTQDDIIRMAREAGAWSQQFKNRDVEYVLSAESLERLAALVAAAEREACAALVDENAMGCENPVYRSLLQANAEAIRARGQE
jgi:hypothetical protein